VIHRTNTQVSIHLPDEETFNGTYFTNNNLTGVHSVVTIDFESSVSELISNYSKSNIGPQNTTLTQPPSSLNGYEKIIKIGESVGPGEIVLEQNKVYELFENGVSNIPAVVNATFATAIDGDMTINNSDKISIYNGIVIFKNQYQVLIYLPSEDDFIGQYHTSNNKIGVHSVVTITFESSVKNLVDNYSNINIGPYNQTLFQPSFGNFDNLIKIGSTVAPGEIVLEENNVYELFTDGASNIPNVTNVKLTTIVDGDITENLINLVTIVNN
jgi:hypothetical protein